MKLLKFSLLILVLHIAAAAAIAQQTFSVGLRKEVVVKGLKVKFIEVTEDSRCPEGTNCIWAGVAKVKIQLRKNGKTAVFELNTNQRDRSATFGGYELKLSKLTPYPKASSPVPRASYSATFVIDKAK